MKDSSRTLAPLAVLLVLIALPAHAEIVGGAVTGGISKERDGVFKKLAPPIGKVGSDNHQSPNLFGFDEQQDVTLEQALQVDILVAKGTVVRKKGPKSLKAGRPVASHYVFYDPVNGDIAGKVRFDADIIAIITGTKTLKASDFLATKTAAYLNPTARGIESNDRIRVTGPREITIDFTAVSPGDYIRVLTRPSGKE